MACPLCGDHCTCSFAGGGRVSAPPSLTYEYDDGAAPPDSEESIVEDHVPRAYRVLENLPSEQAREESAASPVRLAEPPEDIVLDSPAPPPDDTMWKQEVADRLQSYRARRGTRRPRYNGTLSLDFDRATNRMMNSALAEEAAPPDAPNEFFGASSTGADAEDRQFIAGCEASQPDTEQHESRQPTADRRQTKSETPLSKVIEFPRLPTLFDPAPGGIDLADPLIDKPRILYVPEEVPTAEAPLADIQLVADLPSPVENIDLPLHVAPMGMRVFAGLADLLIIATAAVAFMAVVLRYVPAPDSRLGYIVVAMLPVVLWAIYQYLFLVHGAATPGMRIAHLSLASFDSELIFRRTRRARALACMLSAFPLGMGLIWALLDDDTLCWHDRITRTYLVQTHRDECIAGENEE